MRAIFLAVAVSFLIASSAAADSTNARVAFLSADAPTAETIGWFDAFTQELRRHGWEAGRNLVIESRRVPGPYDQLTVAATELVQLKVDVIVTDSTPAARAALNATHAIPIVMALAGDPVGTGLVTNLAHPGGNITGFTTLNLESSGKRLELLKEVKARISRVAVLQNPTNSTSPSMLKETEAAATRLGIRLQSLEIRSPADLVGAFQAASREKAAALVGLPDNLLASQHRPIRDFAVKNRLLEISWSSEWVEAGSLMSYGANMPDLYRRTATVVEKILKGAKPADLPVEQPTKFELVINLKTAKQIGLTIPPNVLARADRVIR